MPRLRFTAVLAALAIAGCEAPADGVLSPEVHAQPSPLAQSGDGVVDGRDLLIWRSSFPGSGDLRIYEGARTPASTSGDDDDGLIFEFADGSIIGRTSPSSGTPGDEDVFGPIAHTVGPQIFDPHGNLLCEADYGDQAETYLLRDADGEVLFTLFRTLVFRGAATIPSQGLSHKGFGFLAYEQGHDLHLLYSYIQFQVHRGWWPDGEVLATATDIIQLATPMRHLVIAAMIDGKCGSLGVE